jgi:Uma2 family endonuclease
MSSIPPSGALPAVQPPLPAAFSPPRYGAVVLSGIGWQTYEAILADLGDHPGVRLTYDRGSLQIMSPLPEQGRYADLLGQFVRVLASKAKSPFACFRSTTFRREDLERGLEPDDCFYLTSLGRMLGRRDLDLTRDPPPDLAIEVDVTHSSINRLAISAALGVPEVWRIQGEQVICLVLNAARVYEQRDNSLAFPFLRVADLSPFLPQVFGTDEGSLVEGFRTWLRTRDLPRQGAGPAASGLP